MTFHSILFERTEDSSKKETLEAPIFFVDLNLDQIIDAITDGRQEYDLKPFFYTSLNDIDAITYRHEIMLDLENKILFEHIQSFAQKMRAMREHLTQASKFSYKYQKERWFLDAVEMYCDAVHGLAHDLTLVDVQSRGFLAFREYVTDYANSGRFTSLLAETKKLKADLSAVKYCLLIRGNRIKVRKYESEIDYCAKNGKYLDETIAIFDREIQFYMAYLEYIAIIKRGGLKFCYPQISNTWKEVYDYEGFDVALAYKLMTENSSVVCNDFSLKGKERIFVVTGPNQGGKTTFVRTFGQVHYLTSIGCPVPGREAQLFLFDRLFTHFEKEENIKDLRGKLQDDLVRIYHMLNQATSNSMIILNEIFTSTTLDDALFLSKKIMEKILQLDLLCVWVTFIDELTSFSEQTVSMVSTVVPENPAVRTYKIVRRPADGLAHALAIAEKYRLTYLYVKERLKS